MVSFEIMDDHKKRGIQEGRCKRRDTSFRSLHNKVNAKKEPAGQCH